MSEDLYPVPCPACGSPGPLRHMTGLTRLNRETLEDFYPELLPLLTGTSLLVRQCAFGLTPVPELSSKVGK